MLRRVVAAQMGENGEAPLWTTRFDKRRFSQPPAKEQGGQAVIAATGKSGEGAEHATSEGGAAAANGSAHDRFEA